MKADPLLTPYWAFFPPLEESGHEKAKRERKKGEEMEEFAFHCSKKKRAMNE